MSETVKLNSVDFFKQIEILKTENAALKEGYRECIEDLERHRDKLIILLPKIEKLETKNTALKSEALKREGKYNILMQDLTETKSLLKLRNAEPVKYRQENAALKSELKIYKEELECKRKDNRLFVEHAELVQGDLRKELEALRATEDCTSQEIEITKLKSTLEEMVYDLHGYNPTMAKYWEGRISNKGISTDHIPDTEKPANKERL